MCLGAEIRKNIDVDSILSCNMFNSFTATGVNNRLLQKAWIQMRRLNEPSHLDLCSLSFSLNFTYKRLSKRWFAKIKKKKQMINVV